MVIIASCIPTLHPLLEMILRKRALRSYNTSRDQYKGSGSYNIGSASFNRSKRSHVRKPELTITGVESQGSQENILQLDANKHLVGHPLSQIRRTDNVTVEYESRSGAVEDGRGFW